MTNTHPFRQDDRLFAHDGVVEGPGLLDAPSVVFATERMDDDPSWRALADAELVHVGPDLDITCTTAAIAPPRHRLTMADLNSTAAASQSVSETKGPR